MKGKISRPSREDICGQMQGQPLLTIYCEEVRVFEERWPADGAVRTFWFSEAKLHIFPTSPAIQNRKIVGLVAGLLVADDTGITRKRRRKRRRTQNHSGNSGLFATLPPPRL